MSSYYGDKTRDVPSWDSLDRAEDDDIIRSEYQYANRDHILFCIDASSTMQRPQADERNEAGVIRGKSALHQVLEAVVRIEKGKVITGPADSVGLLLYNIDADKAGSSSSGNYKPGTFVYQTLQTINAEEIKKIIKLMEAANEQYLSYMDDDDPKTAQPAILSETFPPCEADKELNVADVLVTCNFIFRDAGSRMNGNKRVFLVTDNDEPPGSSSTRQAARTTFGDLDTYGITINTFFVDKPGHRFNPTIYWNDILNRDEGEDDPAGEDADEEGLQKLQEIMNDLVIKQAPKRVQFSIPLKLGGKDGDIEIGASGYALVSEQGKGQPKYVRMRGQTVEEVVTRSEYTSAETGAVLRPEEIGQAFQFGNESTVKNILEPNWWESDEQIQEHQQVADALLKRDEERRRQRDEGGEDAEDEAMDEEPASTSGVGQRNGDSEVKPKVVAKTRLRFTDSEVAEMRSLGLAPQIKILGFQSSDLLQIDENVKHSYFIYPNEDAYTGSTRTFSALLQSCAKLDKHALALCRFRRNSTPEFAVLIPQPEQMSEDGKSQDMPPGFHVILLPFRDDIRAPPKNMVGSEDIGTEQQVLAMEKIVTRLKSRYGSYNPDAYPNPALAYHYAQLQALAFEEDFDPSDPDKIAELDKTFPKHGGMHKIAGKYMEAWNNAIRDDERAVETLKGGTKRGAAGAGAGKIGVDAEDLMDIEGAWRNGTMAKMKVADFREWAKYHQVSLGGASKKADIIDVISDHLEKHGTAKKTKTG